MREPGIKSTINFSLRFLVHGAHATLEYRAHWRDILKSLDIVFNEYILTSITTVNDKSSRRLVTSDTAINVDLEIKKSLPALFLSELEKTGRNPTSYKIYGSVGQLNFPLAKI